MAKLTTAEFIDAIKELSVLELNDLVKACEEEFGVSAAAGVVVAAAGGDAAAAEEKDEFDVELTAAGASKVKVIKVVRDVLCVPAAGTADFSFNLSSIFLRIALTSSMILM